MQKKRSIAQRRNWALVVTASFLLLVGVMLVGIAITNIASLGWWSFVIGLGGLSTFSLSLLSIITNNPSWILLDLILPG